MLCVESAIAIRVWTSCRILQGHGANRNVMFMAKQSVSSECVCVCVGPDTQWMRHIPAVLRGCSVSCDAAAMYCAGMGARPVWPGLSEQGCFVSVHS